MVHVGADRCLCLSVELFRYHYLAKVLRRLILDDDRVRQRSERLSYPSPLHVIFLLDADEREKSSFSITLAGHYCITVVAFATVVTGFLARVARFTNEAGRLLNR